MIQIDPEKFEKLKNLTEIEYKKVVSVYSPALKSEVVFNSDGFHHLRYDSSRAERSKKAQCIKFIYFNKAVEIIKLSTTIQEYRRGICPVGKPDKSGLRKTKTVEWFAFFSIISFTKRTRIRVVVRRVGMDGQYHFWSVMPFWSLSNNQRIVGSKEIEDE
jgi:hypothetical protein